MALDLETLQKHLLFRTRATPVQVIADLQAVDASLPQTAEEAQRGEKNGFLLIAAGLFGSVLWLIVTKNLTYDSTLPMFTFPILVGGVGFGIRLLARYSGVTSQVYDLRVRTGRRRELVKTLLTRLRPDLEPGSQVDLMLDQNTGIHPHTLVREEKRGVWDSQDYKFPWLSLQARLQDGTHLSVSAVEHARKMSKSRVNARGKRKYKYRTHDFTVFQVALRVKPRTHPGLASLEGAARRAVRLPPGMELKRLRVAEDRLELQVRVWSSTLDTDGRDGLFAPAGPQPMPEASRVVTMMLLSLYQTLGYARNQLARAV